MAKLRNQDFGKNIESGRQEKDMQIFSVKDPKMNVLQFVGHKISHNVSTLKAAKENS